MNKLNEVLEALRGGEMALENDGNKEQTKKAIKIIWPTDPYAAGDADFYFDEFGNWGSAFSNPCSTSISVTEFLKLWEGKDEGKGWPTISEAGVKAVEISEMVRPKLNAQEQAMFVAGFQECIKWITINSLAPNGAQKQ